MADVNDVQIRAKLSHERRRVTQRLVRFVGKIGRHENSADCRHFLRGWKQVLQSCEILFPIMPLTPFLAPGRQKPSPYCNEIF